MQRYPEFGYLSSTDMDMLSRVLAATAPADISEEERQLRAARIVRLFQSGIDTEEELIAEMGRPAP